MAVAIGAKAITTDAFWAEVTEASDQYAIQGLVRTAAGTASLYTDAFVTTIAIGGGASNTIVTVGGASTRVDVPNALNVGTGITPSTANGDIVAGDGTNEMAWDASAKLLRVGDALYGAATPGAVAVTGPGSYDHYHISANTAGGTFRGLKARGTPGAPTVYLNGDQALSISGFGYHPSAGGDGMMQLGAIRVIADGAPGATSAPGKLQFGTTPTGAQFSTDRWEMLNAGHFVAVADNTYDIGASGATRPRTIYVGTSVLLGADVTLSADAEQALINGGPVPHVLATSGTIDLTATATTPLYTVPAGKKCVTTEVRVRVTVSGGSGSDADVSIISALGDVIASTTLLGLAATDDSFPMREAAASVLTLAGDSVDFDVTTGATASVMDVEVDLIGYLVAA